MSPAYRVTEGPKWARSPSSTFPAPQKALPSTAASGCVLRGGESWAKTVPRWWQDSWVQSSGQSSPRFPYSQERRPPLGLAPQGQQRGRRFPPQRAEAPVSGQSPATEPPATQKSAPSALAAVQVSVWAPGSRCYEALWTELLHPEPCEQLQGRDRSHGSLTVVLLLGYLNKGPSRQQAVGNTS